jgi:uncharacterized protein (DUF58 family)
MAAVVDSALQELLEEVRRVELFGRRLSTGTMSGEYASVFRGAGIEFDEVRDYVEGDDPRAVDWNVTARAGRPQVKQFVDERQQSVHFVVDLSASMTCGPDGWSARLAAARVVACLAQAALRNQDRIALTAVGGRVERYLPPGKGRRALLRILRDCLALPAPAGPTDLVPGLQWVGRVARRNSLVFLVSDFLADGWPRAARACAACHDLVAVRLSGPALQLPRGGGLLRLRDPEHGVERWVDADHPPTRAAWAQRLDRWQRRVEQELARARVELLDVALPPGAQPDAVARPILRFFHRRRTRRGGR